MRNRLFFSALLLALALVLPKLGAAGCSCTVTCPNNPDQSCTSDTGQCESGLVGLTYWIGCDGGADECVPPR